MKVCNLLDTQGQFLCFEEFKRKFGVRCTFLDYTGVLAVIPKLWKSKILGNSPIGGEPFTSLSDSDNILSTKKACLILAEQSFSPPIVETTLCEQVSNVKDVYELPFKVTVENKLKSFQFKILHNIIPTNLSLYKMNVKEIPQCEATKDVDVDLHEITIFDVIVDHLFHLRVDYTNVMDLFVNILTYQARPTVGFLLHLQEGIDVRSEESTGATFEIPHFVDTGYDVTL